MPTAEILAGIQRFRKHFQENSERYRRLVTQGQSPQVLFIACSDSRVAPELITGADLGDLFVVRSVGNAVPPFGVGDMAAGTAIEYAVRHLRVKHVVVCGHTDCGCIKALAGAIDSSREPHIARWLDHLRPAKTKVEASGLAAKEQPLATVRENVLLQIEHLRSYDPVWQAERAGTLAVHGWVYHLEDGTIEAYDARSGGWGPAVPPAG